MHREKQSELGPLYINGNLSMRRVVRDIVAEFLKERNLAPSSPNVAKKMGVKINTPYNVVTTGGFNAKSLTALIATIADGDPISFLMRHPAVLERFAQTVRSTHAVKDIERKTREALIARLQEPE